MLQDEEKGVKRIEAEPSDDTASRVVAADVHGQHGSQRPRSLLQVARATLDYLPVSLDCYKWPLLVSSVAYYVVFCYAFVFYLLPWTSLGILGVFAGILTYNTPLLLWLNRNHRRMSWFRNFVAHDGYYGTRDSDDVLEDIRRELAKTKRI